MPHPRSQGLGTKHTYHMCVWYILPKFPRFVSVTGSNIFVQQVNFAVYLEVTLQTIFFNPGAGRAFCFPLVFCIIAVKDPFTFTKCFSVLLRVHDAYMSARVNYHLPRNFFFFLFFSVRPLSGYIQCGKC